MESLLDLQRMVRDSSRDLQGLDERQQLRDGLERVRRVLEMVVEDVEDSDSLEVSRSVLSMVRRELR